MSSHRVEPFPTDMSNPCLKAFINSTQDPYVVKQSLTLPRSGHIQAQNAGDSMQWRSSHQSECETVLDSGYGSVPGYPFDTASMISQPVGDHGRDVRDLAGEFANPNDFRGVGSGFINNWQGMQSHPNSKGLFRCSHPGCKNPFCKTRSELKYALSLPCLTSVLRPTSFFPCLTNGLEQQAQKKTRKAIQVFCS